MDLARSPAEPKQTLARPLRGPLKNSARLPDLENIALGIAAIADFSAFKIPFSFNSIHGAAQLCCPTSRDRNVLGREYKLDRRVFAAFRRRCDLNRGCDTFWNPDDYQLRWLTAK